MSKYKLLYPVTVTDNDSLIRAVDQVNNKDSLWVRQFYTPEVNPNKLVAAQDFVTEGFKYHSLNIKPEFIGFGEKSTKYYVVTVTSTLEQLEANEAKVLAIENRVRELDKNSTIEEAKKHNQFIDSTAAKFKG